jgi:hypothetical protein
MPCFLNSPFSSAIQVRPEVALTELRPTRILSWAGESSGDTKHDRKNTVKSLRTDCTRFIKPPGEHLGCNPSLIAGYAANCRNVIRKLMQASRVFDYPMKKKSTGLEDDRSAASD